MTATRTCPMLLEQIRNASDAMAWDEFFQRYWPLVYGYARHRGCSDHTADEIVQEVMLKIFQKRDVFHYDPARGRFRDWLHRVVSNQLAEHRRRPAERVRARGGRSSADHAETEGSEPEPDAAWEHAFEQSLMTALLNIVRREMNPRDFVAFELTELGRQRPAEAARVTGMTRNMVYKARRKVLDRLKQLAGSYASDGQLRREAKSALRSLPEARVERCLTRSVEKTMRSR
jgi:RNA polymerase sigma-70 factor (ECF subfamily)